MTITAGAVALALTVIAFAGLPAIGIKPIPLAFQPTVNTDYSKIAISLVPGATLAQTQAVAVRVTDAAGRREWDVAFLAIDPVRGRELDYTAAYVAIEGSYAAAAASPVRSLEEVDQAGVRVAVSGGSAYDLFLTRALARATLVRLASAAAARDAVLSGTADILAGVRQQVEGFAAGEPRLRPLPGRFMAIDQAVAIPKGREAALPFLRAFVEREKASGRVGTALVESGQDAAALAPPAP